MARMRHTLGPMIAYHGCDRSVGEAVLSGKTQLYPSVNEYDWLGPGIYFWVDSAERGLEWARELANRKASGIRNPCVLGALIYPSLCLNLTDYGAMAEILKAYELLKSNAAEADRPLPRNTVRTDGILLRRALDCAVINTTHGLRKKSGQQNYDTVYGVFEEGTELYPGAGFRSKTHLQIAVRNPECIVGYFRVQGF